MTQRNHKPKIDLPNNVTQPEKTNLSTLRQDLDLWYRIHVLLYDLSNVAKDPSSERRICSTTNELYISEPYFTDSEASRIRTAIVDGVLDNTDNINHAATNITVEAEEEETTCLSTSDGTSTFTKDATVEEMIHSKLSNFFVKRKASGDARPCGPHDMLPVYLSVFGVAKEDLKDEHFVSRLRRSGLGDRQSGEGKQAEDQPTKYGKGRKRDR